LGTTEAAWTSFAGISMPDQTLVFVTTVKCGATRRIGAGKNLSFCGLPSLTIILVPQRSQPGWESKACSKTHRVFEDASDEIWQAFVNVTAHEIGHMGNRHKHSKKGLMKYPVPLNVDIDFDEDDKYSFLSDLARLRNLKE
jgi:hypothetical protein